MTKKSIGQAGRGGNSGRRKSKMRANEPPAIVAARRAIKMDTSTPFTNDDLDDSHGIKPYRKAKK